MLHRDVTVQVALTDQGGGIGKVLWQINGVTVSSDPAPARTLAVADPQGHPTVLLPPKALTLLPGDSTIVVTAYNARNDVASAPARLLLTLEDTLSTPPTLCLLVIGINRYSDHALWLKYAVADARAIARALPPLGTTLFQGTTSEEVLEEHATLAGIEAAFARLVARVEPQDVFVLYLVGHGITQEGHYYFLPQNFRYSTEASIPAQAIHQEHFQRWLATIRTRKSVVLIDTCASGMFVNAVAGLRGVALAEKTAMEKLVRATGRATIVATTADQPAREGYQGHGVFTYALLQALRQADSQFGNRDGLTGLYEVAAYIDDQVPKLSLQAFGFEQFPQVHMHGHDFPLGIVRPEPC